MKLENTVCFRCDLYKCPDSHKFWDVVKSINCINDVWIPQTIGDQIWMWFEFATIEDKELYLKGIQDLTVFGVYDVMKNGKTYEEEQTCKPIEMLMNGEDWLTQAEMDYWVGDVVSKKDLSIEEKRELEKQFIETLKREGTWDKLQSLMLFGKRLK